jgi:hypothetical protein
VDLTNTFSIYLAGARLRRLRALGGCTGVGVGGVLRRAMPRRPRLKAWTCANVTA